MPLVTVIEKTEPKPRMTRQQRAAITTKTSRANNRKRPHTILPDGYSAPTVLEIEEGLAHKMMSQSPNSKMLYDEWLEVHWRLCELEGVPATTRCDACHVVRFGRPCNVCCGACGSLERWLPQMRRLNEAA